MTWLSMHFYIRVSFKLNDTKNSVSLTLKNDYLKKKNPKGLNSENTKLEITHEKLKSVLKMAFDDM